jgi:pyrroline-5-carboxylate reductase
VHGITSADDLRASVIIFITWILVLLEPWPHGCDCSCGYVYLACDLVDDSDFLFGGMMLEGQKIGFIGGGNMGEALIKGLLSAALFRPEEIFVYDVSSARKEHLKNSYGVSPQESIAALAKTSQLIILAVKPQTMSAVLDELQSHLSHRPLMISIAAGISISTISSSLPEGMAVIRVMPNTPALVLKGASALSRGTHVTDEQMEQALAIFGAVGTAQEVEEKLMDTVTGLSGSGPAYVLLMIESLIDAGVLMGLSRNVARELTVQTVLGTAIMLQETGKHPAELKDLITSPAGTTIHGLQVLEDRSFRGAILGAVEAATLQSKKLGKQ